MSSPSDYVGKDKTTRIPNQAGKIPSMFPKLGSTEGYKLTGAEINEWFGVNERRFASLPKRFIVPELNTLWQNKYYKAYGYLYVIEPIEWVPFVTLAQTVPKSKFKTTYKGTTTTISSTEYKVKAMAKISVTVGGGVSWIKGEAEASVETEAETNSSQKVEKEIVEEGSSGDTAIHLVKLLPRLRCRILKHQVFEVRYYNEGDKYFQLGGGEISKEKLMGCPAICKRTAVTRERQQAIEPLIMDPTPIRGDTKDQWMGSCIRSCTVPYFKSGEKEPDWFTLIGPWLGNNIMFGWNGNDMYLYEEDWKNGPVANEPSEVVLDVANAGEVAFQPGATWITASELKDAEVSASAAEGYSMLFKGAN